ncbi:MAG: hypothetical protein U9N36_03305 [Euryarchaeota archaeon]|nr:hypothetical protein [Euryarchaeota archaeon]
MYADIVFWYPKNTPATRPTGHLLKFSCQPSEAPSSPPPTKAGASVGRSRLPNRVCQKTTLLRTTPAGTDRTHGGTRPRLAPRACGRPGDARKRRAEADKTSGSGTLGTWATQGRHRRPGWQVVASEETVNESADDPANESDSGTDEVGDGDASTSGNETESESETDDSEVAS